MSPKESDSPKLQKYKYSRGGYYADPPVQSTISLHPPRLKHSPSIRSVSCQRSFLQGGNVIGPASSMKNLENRAMPNTDGRYSDEDSGEKCHRFLKLRKTNIRRSNSDMQRRLKRPSVVKNSLRSVYSDGENKNDISDSLTGLTVFGRNYSFRFSTLINRHFNNEMHLCCHDRENFLKSLKEFYLETMGSLQKKKIRIILSELTMI